MEKCKYCEAELEENSTVCPSCGKDNAEPQEETPAVQETAAEETAAEETPVEENQPSTEQTEEADETAAPETEEPQTAEEPAPEQKKGGELKIAFAVTVIVLLIAILAAVIWNGMKKSEPQDAVQDAAAGVPEAVETEATVPPTVPADGNPDDATCKGTYTADNDTVIAARDRVVATAGKYELTVGQLQVYYWMEVRNFLNNYGMYASYVGLDLNQGLDTQMCGISDTPMTWQQYFLSAALNSWQNYQGMAAEGEKNGHELSAENQAILDSLEADLESSAVENGYANGTEVLHKSMGAAAEIADYAHFMDVYYRGFDYYAATMEALKPTDEEVEAYFTEHELDYGDNDVTRDTVTVNVRHILVYPEGADGTNINTTEFSDEAWAGGEAQAQAILDEWLAGEMTEDSFAALANERSGDPGSNTNGGLYTDVNVGEMVPAFNDWCFDPNRQVGDYGIVKTNYGFHVMFFSGTNPKWMDYARQDYMNEKGGELIDAAVANCPMNVDYTAILLADANLA